MGLLAKLPRWATGGGAGITEPLESKKDSGWIASEKPPAQYFNWLFKVIYDACVVLDGLLGQTLTWTSRHTFAAGLTSSTDISVAGQATVDASGANTGTIASSLRFGVSTSGEGVGSKRTSGAGQFGLDLYTNSVQRVSIGSTGAIDCHGNALNNVATPSASTDGANKGYVDRTPVISGSSGTFLVSAAGNSTVTNSTVSITTTGRPVLLLFQPFAGAVNAYMECFSGVVFAVVMRGTTVVGGINLLNGDSQASITVIDPVASGTYSYSVQLQASGGTVSAQVINMQLVAKEF
jgi:hypothetical protein